MRRMLRKYSYLYYSINLYIYIILQQYFIGEGLAVEHWECVEWRASVKQDERGEGGT